MELQAPHTGRSTMDFLKDIWDTEGPLGIPMKDRQALAIEELLKGLPRTEDYQPRRVLLKDAMTEWTPGERADVSWISTEDRDRDLEVVISKGMNDEAFKLNPDAHFVSLRTAPDRTQKAGKLQLRRNEKVLPVDIGPGLIGIDTTNRAGSPRDKP